MDEREFEDLLGNLMKQDLAAGSESFRDALLERCLDVLGSRGAGRRDAEEFRAYQLSDSELDMLAAAGEQALFPTEGFLGDEARNGD